MGTAQINLFGTGVSWDRYSISLDSGDTKRSIYLSEGKKGVSASTLYSSTTQHSGLRGFLPGRLGRDHSVVEVPPNAFGECLLKVRDVIGDFVSFVIPVALFNGDFASFSTFRKIIYLSFTLLADLSLVATAVSLGVVPLIVQIGVTILLGVGLRYISAHVKFGRYFPLETALPFLALGVAASLPSAVVVSSVANGVISGLNRLGLRTDGNQQDVDHLLDIPQVRWFVAAYAVIGAPLIEEIIFRGALTDYFVKGESPQSEKVTKQTGITFERFMTMVKVSVIFGLCHMSANQGWLNIPIAIATGLLGLAASLAGELTGDLWAPLGLHAANNGLAVAQHFLQ